MPKSRDEEDCSGHTCEPNRHECQPTGSVALHPEAFGDRSVYVRCPQCKKSGYTNVEYKEGALTWIICVLLIGICLCCIPLCCNSCKDVFHSCRNCGAPLGRYKQL